MRPLQIMNQQQAAFLWRIISGTTTPDDAADLYVPLPSVDLRSIPRDGWREHVMRSVAIPPDLERFLAGQTAFTQDELNSIEDRLTAYHGVTSPFYITAKAGPPFDAWLGFDAHDHSNATL